jgi:hypothetical protein
MFATSSFEITFTEAAAGPRMVCVKYKLFLAPTKQNNAE